VGSVRTRRPSGTWLRLHDIASAMAVLDLDGRILDATDSAADLLRRFTAAAELPAALPAGLAAELARAPLGEAVMWRPGAEVNAVLGCTRYRLGAERVLLLMREITEQQRALSQRLHQQRLEATGRLVAQIAHDLRTPLASIVYNADLLGKRAAELPAGVRDLLRDIQLPAEEMRRTIAGLLDFVRLGPPVAVTLSLREIVDRVSSLLRPAFRAGAHRLQVALHDEAVCVCGNPLAIETIFVNLLVNATEAKPSAVQVRLTSEAVAAAPAGHRPWRALDDMVLVRVADDGPGIPPAQRSIVFEPFFTSKADGTGLGLTTARDAAAALGGHLALEESAAGCSFAVVLPVARPPAGEEAPS
jgi:signal transduction histidine kinase